MENKPTPNITINQQRNEPGCLVQGLYFLLVGWWLGGLASGLAWILNITILGIPLGMAILNNIPKLIALQSSQRYVTATVKDGRTVISEIDVPQRSFLVRAIYFLLIGWWWSAIWLSLAYVFCLLIILMPVGLSMFRLTPAMTTLKRY